MNFKTFLIQKIILGFFVSFTLISLAMLVIGFIYEPDRQFGYEIFVSPLVFALVATLPSLLIYSSKELSLKATLVRKVIHLLLLEVLIIGVLYISHLITSFNLLISLGLTIAIIDVSVQVILYINDQRTAMMMNTQIKKYQLNHTHRDDSAF